MKYVKIPFYFNDVVYYTFRPNLIYKTQIKSTIEIKEDNSIRYGINSGWARWFNKNGRDYNLFATFEEAIEACKDWQKEIGINKEIRLENLIRIG